MAQRDERLAPATRNYVIFGLVFVVAIGLAVRDWLDPRERRGEADSPLRLLLVSDDADGPASALTDVDGFSVAQVSPSVAIAEGHELLDDDEAPDHRAAIAYADQLGFGFVALDLVGEHDVPLDWGLSEAPPGSARFAVFSVGDVAIETPRMRSVGMPEDLSYDPRLVALDSLRLALYDHPDLTRLWTDELAATELQARRVLDSRKLDDRRTTLARDHATWRELADVWPKAELIPGSLAGAWEQVQAAPIPGGLLLEVRAMRVHVDINRRPRLEIADEATLEFLPFAELRDHQVGARQPCSGLPERLTGESSVAVAPDGSAVVIGGRLGTTELFVFEQRADDPELQCRARSIGPLAIGDRSVGRPNAAGAMAWSYDDDWLHWWDAHGEHRVRVEGIHAYSGPWWLADELLAMIGERTVAGTIELEDGPAFGYEPALVLLDSTATNEDTRARVELGLRELLASDPSDPTLELPNLLDLRPAGATGLLLTTERCRDQPLDDDRPCLHRLAIAAPITASVRELAAGSRTLADTLTVETLGSLDPHVELAVAADGSRVAWIDRRGRHLQVADLRGPRQMVARRIDADPNPEMSLRISADGRVVLGEITVELTLGNHSLGLMQIPRAFVLDPVQ